LDAGKIGLHQSTVAHLANAGSSNEPDPALDPQLEAATKQIRTLQLQGANVGRDVWTGLDIIANKQLATFAYEHQKLVSTHHLLHDVVI
jgi:hypothetical protein